MCEFKKDVAGTLAGCLSGVLFYMPKICTRTCRSMFWSVVEKAFLQSARHILQKAFFQTRIKQSEGFYKMLYKENYEDKIYSLNKTVPGQTQDLSQAIQKTLENNGGVGMLTGYYDQNLSILSVSNLLLHSIGHTFDSFMKQTKGSLKKFFLRQGYKYIGSRPLFCRSTEPGKRRSLQRTVQ